MTTVAVSADAESFGVDATGYAVANTAGAQCVLNSAMNCAYHLFRWGNDEARDNNGAVIPNC